MGLSKDSFLIKLGGCGKSDSISRGSTYCVFILNWDSETRGCSSEGLLCAALGPDSRSVVIFCSIQELVPIGSVSATILLVV